MENKKKKKKKKNVVNLVDNTNNSNNKYMVVYEKRRGDIVDSDRIFIDKLDAYIVDSISI
jgi:hypothetical protein